MHFTTWKLGLTIRLAHHRMRLLYAEYNQWTLPGLYKIRKIGRLLGIDKSLPRRDRIELTSRLKEENSKHQMACL